MVETKSYFSLNVCVYNYYLLLLCLAYFLRIDKCICKRCVCESGCFYLTLLPQNAMWFMRMTWPVHWSCALRYIDPMLVDSARSKISRLVMRSRNATPSLETKRPHVDLFQFLQVPAVQVPRITSAEERSDDDCIVHLLVSLEGVCNALWAVSYWT